MKKLVLLLLVSVLSLTAQIIADLYIVELSGEPAATLASAAGKNVRAALSGSRAMVAAEQSEMRRRLASSVPRARILGAVDTAANALIVSVPDAEAARLGTTPGVKRVFPVQEVRLELDHAVPLHKAPAAWQQAGGEDKAGLGVKIGIIDTGIDHTHPAFKDDSLSVPSGFPKVTEEAHREFTTNKIIVARTYGQLLGRDPNVTPADRVGHGSGVAMAAAGVRNDGPIGPIVGMAPKAFLGNYNVFDSTGRSTRTDVILSALNDAINDGMDVVNLSLGTEPAPRVTADILVDGVERAYRMGVQVIKSAGNNGGNLEGPFPASISSPGTAPSAITVGASYNDRFFYTGVRVDDAPAILAFPGSGPTPEGPVRGQAIDAAKLDPTGLVCAPAAGGSLAGRVVLILRGVCTFEEKLNNALAGGAAAAVLYTDAERPDPILMDVRGATLPAVMLAYVDGARVKEMIAANESATINVVFDTQPFPLNPNNIAPFSAKGPNTDLGIKPDVTAAGIEIYTATQKSNPGGDLYDPKGYLIADGTSYSSPIAAGGMALIKSFRPNLTADQYRSLLINSATTLVYPNGRMAAVQHSGAGMLDVDAALRNITAARPTSLGFGFGGGSFDLMRELSITNLSGEAQSYSIQAEPYGGGPVATLSASTLEVAAGQTGRIEVKLAASGVEPGEHQGFIRILTGKSTVETRVPYWYAVQSTTPRFLSAINPPTSGAAESTVSFMVRVMDESGVPMPTAELLVTPIQGGGAFVSTESVDDFYPGVSRVRVRLGPFSRANTFRIEAGPQSTEVTITGRATAP